MIPQVAKRFLIVVFLIFTMTSIYAVGSAFLRSKKHERSAVRLLAILDQLKVGKVSETDVANSTRSFSPEMNGPQKNAEGEYRSFIFDNYDLTRLGLSRYRRFTVIFRFKDGVLSEKDAQFWVDGNCRISVSEREAGVPPNELLRDPRLIHFSTVPAGYEQPVLEASITDDPSYSEESKRMDWKFDLAQLTHLGSCNDARLLLPTLTHRQVK